MLVTLAAYPGRILHGKVLFVSDVVEADSRRNKIRIAFPNPEYALKPNMFATITVFGPEQSRVVVPTSALLMNNDRTSVFVATAPWTFERRTVVPLLEFRRRGVVSHEPGSRVLPLRVHLDARALMRPRKDSLVIEAQVWSSGRRLDDAVA